MEFIPGVCAGIAQTLVGHPFDTVKTLIQNNQKWRNLSIYQYYRGAVPIFIGSALFNGQLFPTQEYLTQIVKLPNYVSGFITGITVSPTIYIFENMKILRQTHTPIKSSIVWSGRGLFATCFRESIAFSIYFTTYDYCKHLGMHSFISGSICGMLCWIPTYPIDVVRTRQIAQNISFSKAWKQQYLYQGIGIVLFRSCIVNGCVFSTYEFFS